jgi:hypothetical protein
VETRALRIAILAVTICVVVSGCSTSEAALQKAAQANADKYYELLKTGNPEGAYRDIFSKAFKSNMDLERYLKYRQGIDGRLGSIVEYQVAEAKVDPNLKVVTMTYLLRTSHLQEPMKEVVRFRLEGSEWRMDEFEPQYAKPKPAQPPTNQAPL